MIINYEKFVYDNEKNVKNLFTRKYSLETRAYSGDRVDNYILYKSKIIDDTLVHYCCERENKLCNGIPYLKIYIQWGGKTKHNKLFCSPEKHAYGKRCDVIGCGYFVMGDIIREDTLKEIYRDNKKYFKDRGVLAACQL